MTNGRAAPAGRGDGTVSRAGWLGPACLALLAYAGPLKASPLLSWLPFDLTVALALLITIAAILSRLRNGPAHRTIAIPLVLLLLLLLGIDGSSFGEYAQSKMLGLYTLTALAMLAPFYLTRSRQQVTIFLSTLVTLAAVVAIVTVLSPGSVDEYTTIVTLAGTNTISTGRMISTGAVVALVFAIASGVALRRRLLALAAAAALLVIALTTGSRGPFLAIGAALFGVLLVAPMFRRYRARALAVAVILTAAVTFFALRAGGDGVARIFTTLSGEADNSVQVRTRLLDLSIQSIAAKPFGVGLGDLIEIPGLLPYSVSDRLYPHNVLVEVLAEAGWIPGLMLIAFMIVSLVRAGRASQDAQSTTLFALLIFAYVNALTSGDINDNRLMWIMLSCGLATSWSARRLRSPEHRSERTTSPMKPLARSKETKGSRLE